MTPLRRQFVFQAGALALFCAAVACLWYVPVLFAGYSYEIPHLHPARNFADTGTFTMKDDIGRYVMSEHHPASISAKDGRLSTMLFAAASPWIGWTNLAGWARLSIAVVSLSLIPLWIAVAGLFGRRVAWVTVVITAFMPAYWQQAIYLSNFQFALFFYLCSLAAFVLLRKRHFLALGVSGLFFGLSVASKDLFLIFLPWYALVYAWMHRRNPARIAGGAALFLGVAFCVYLAPYIGDIRMHGYPVNWNIARVWPGAEEIANETYLHLYPDPYTYFFDREQFDSAILQQEASIPTLDRLQLQKTLRAYGVGEWGLLRTLGNGSWLFINSIPSFFHLSTIGGVFLWLFILPGAVFLWRKDRRMTVLLWGVILTAYVVIRFVLGYNREHFEDVGWILAAFAALGVVQLSDVLSSSFFRRVSSTVVCAVITFFIALQLLQANRVEMARLYRRPLITDSLALARAMEQVPGQSVIAMPLHPMRTTRITFLAGRTTVIFAEDTIRRLLAEGKLDEAFAEYGVTHVARYPGELTQSIRQAAPGTAVIADEAPGVEPPNVTTFLRYLLHHVY